MSDLLDGMTCAYEGCGRPADCAVNGLGMCIDHIDWLMGVAFAPVRALRDHVLPLGTPAGVRVPALFESAALALRAAEAYSLAADPDLSQSAQAVALQAEDLARAARERLAPHERPATVGSIEEGRAP